MKRKLLTMMLALTLAFFATVKSNGAQDADSFGSNDSSATSSFDSTENSSSSSSSDDDRDSFSAPAVGTGSGSTSPLSDVVSRVKNFDGDAFLDDHPELIREAIYGVIGIGVLALAFYVVIILPIRFLRWLFGGGKKNVEKRGQGERIYAGQGGRIYADVVHGKDSAHPYVVREDVTFRVKLDKIWDRICRIIAAIIWILFIAFGVYVYVVGR